MIKKKTGTVLALLALAALALLTDPAICGAAGITSLGDGVSGVSWPWTRFLNSLAAELTGPLPMILGVLGIAAAAIALFAGNGGAGTQRFILLIFAISICLFAPTFIQYIAASATGAELMDVLGKG